jgi:hypothetical protein
MIKKTTKADVFRCALAAFSQEMLNHQLVATPDQIARLSISVDERVQFSIDETEMVTFIFTDGSRAIVAPATQH